MRRLRVLAGGLVLVFLVVPSPGASAEGLVPLAGGSTELTLDPHLLEDLGLTLGSWEDPARGLTEPLRFRILTSETLHLELPSGSYRGPASGVLKHRGGLRLRWEGGELSLEGFELHPGIPPDTFELRAADASLAFVLDHPHPQPNGDGTAFLFRDMDLRLSAELAARIGRPRLAGMVLGEAHVEALLAAAPEAAAGDRAPSLTPGLGEACVPDFSGTVDVALDSISTVSERGHDNERVALAPAVTLKNVGVADIPWYRPIAPDGWPPLDVVGQHPFLVMNLYRLADDRIEQIGRSDVKHAFFAANTPPCNCQSDQVLFNDCTDLYNAWTNSSRKLLAPRHEITASTGAWEVAGSHFDHHPSDPAQANDSYRSHDEADHPDPFEHRLTARAIDLLTEEAEYRIEAWYLVAGDVDIFNSMGSRKIVPIPGAPWIFPFDDAGLTLGPALDRWVDPASPAPGSSNSTVTTTPDEGELKLAVKATALPTGLYHYELALMNFDLDRGLASLEVPLPAGVEARNLWFGDGDDNSGNDWTATVGSAILWDGGGAPLEWGTLVNFAFEANAPPAAATLTLGVAEAGSPATLTVAGVAPATPFAAFELAVSREGDGAGAVISLPAGVDCGADCAEWLASGMTVELSAAAAAGSAFVRWEEDGEALTRDRSLDLVISGDRSVSSIFEPCQESVDLAPQTVSEPEVFFACDSLSAGPGFEIEAEAIFRAGRSIALGDGFQVIGGSFTAELASEQQSPPPG